MLIHNPENWGCSVLGSFKLLSSYLCCIRSTRALTRCCFCLRWWQTLQAWGGGMYLCLLACFIYMLKYVFTTVWLRYSSPLFWTFCSPRKHYLPQSLLERWRPYRNIPTRFTLSDHYRLYSSTLARQNVRTYTPVNIVLPMSWPLLQYSVDQLCCHDDSMLGLLAILPCSLPPCSMLVQKTK